MKVQKFRQKKSDTFIERYVAGEIHVIYVNGGFEYKGYPGRVGRVPEIIILKLLRG